MVPLSISMATPRTLFSARAEPGRAEPRQVVCEHGKELPGYSESPFSSGGHYQSIYLSIYLAEQEASGASLTLLTLTVTQIEH